MAFVSIKIELNILRCFRFRVLSILKTVFASLLRQFGTPWPKKAAWCRPDRPEGWQGFDNRRVEDAFFHACRILNLKRIGPMETGYGRRSRGALVRRHSDGCVFWLKTSGVFDTENWLWSGEREASCRQDLPSLRLENRVEWKQDRTVWAATLSASAPSKAVEKTPLAGPQACMISDRWIEKLKAALDQISRSDTKRQRHSFENLSRVFSATYGIDCSIDRYKWRPAHGDLQWSNLTAPSFSLYDWECFALAPPGFDAAWLIAHSALEPELASRLEKSFADILDTHEGLQVRLYASNRVLEAAKQGGMNPALVPPLEKTVDLLLQRLREPQTCRRPAARFQGRLNMPPDVLSA